MGKVWIITGSQNSGKTSFILELLKQLKEKNLPICGVVSPGVYKNGERIAIHVMNVETGEEKELATLEPGFDVEYPQKKWKMNHEGTLWGNEILRRCKPRGKLLVIDEIGIYELWEGKGWQAGIQIIRAKDYKDAILSVRKETVQPLIQICEKDNIPVKIIDLDQEKLNLNEIKEEIIKNLHT